MKLTIFFILSLSLSILRAQNLVPNPSFEEWTPDDHISRGSASGQKVKYWFSPTNGTPDYFDKWSLRDEDPDNWHPYDMARTGRHFMGLVARYNFELYYDEDYREYIEVKMLEPLKPGLKYDITFHVFCAPNARFIITSMGACITKEILDSLNYDAYLPCENLINNSSQRFLSDKEGWMEIIGSYKAKGGEQYLTIGNFLPNSKTRVQTSPGVDKYNAYDYSYYYIDDVDVSLVGKEFFKRDTINLDNIMFKTNEAELLSGSLETLMKIEQLLTDYPEMVVQIAGHTDNQGSEVKNLRLSTERAKAVADWLGTKGINKNRIKFVGYGSLHPRATNTTDEGRLRNRRVEMIILKR